MFLITQFGSPLLEVGSFLLFSFEKLLHSDGGPNDMLEMRNLGKCSYFTRRASIVLQPYI